MTDRWWVLHEPQILSALRRSHAGESPELLLLEFVANSDIEAVAQGEPALCGGCGHPVFLTCGTPDCEGRTT